MNIRMRILFGIEKCRLFSSPHTWSDGRAQSIQSARLVQWSEFGPPHPHPQKRVLSPSLGPRGETHLAAEEGLGRPDSDEGTDTLDLYRMYTIIPLRGRGFYNLWCDNKISRLVAWNSLLNSHISLNLAIILVYMKCLFHAYCILYDFLW